MRISSVFKLKISCQYQIYVSKKLCQNNMFVSKSHFCVKIHINFCALKSTFLIQRKFLYRMNIFFLKNIFVSKEHFCVKRSFLSSCTFSCQKNIFAQKWHFCAKRTLRKSQFDIIFVPKSDFYAKFVFFSPGFTLNLVQIITKIFDAYPNLYILD